MFGIGSTELVVILVIAVIIIGPRQLPEVARAVGKLFTQFKRASNDLRSAVNEEMYQQEEWQELKDVKNSMESDLHNIADSTRGYMTQEFEEERKSGEALGKELESVAQLSPVAAAAAGKPRAKKGAAKPAKGKPAAQKSPAVKPVAAKSPAAKPAAKSAPKPAAKTAKTAETPAAKVPATKVPLTKLPATKTAPKKTATGPKGGKQQTV